MYLADEFKRVSRAASDVPCTIEARENAPYLVERNAVASMVGAGLAERHSATREHLVDDFGDVADRAALLRGSDVEDVAVHPSRGTSIARTIASGCRVRVRAAAMASAHRASRGMRVVDQPVGVNPVLNPITSWPWPTAMARRIPPPYGYDGRHGRTCVEVGTSPLLVEVALELGPGLPKIRRAAATRAAVATTRIFWHPHRGTPTTAQRAICAGCPVRVDCLEYALGTGCDARLHGVWGGPTGRDRRRSRQRGWTAAQLLEHIGG
jgi:hypothetical protein